MNIQTHAYNLKCNASVRFTKRDVACLLEEMYNATEDPDLRDKLALLYSTMTPKPAVKNNPLAWVATASDPNCERKQFDKMVVYKGYAMAADGFRLHGYKLQASQAAELEGKVIDASGNVLDVENTLPMAHAIKWLIEEEWPLIDTFDLSKCVVEQDRYSSYKFLDTELFGHKCRFDKKHIEQAFNGRQSVKVCTQAGFNGLKMIRLILSESEVAIVMPVRLKGG